MSWALLTGLGWGSHSSPVPSQPMDRVELSQTKHWAGGRAHTLSCCRAFISIYCLPISFTGESVMSQCLCGFSLFWSWKRWDSSEQILLSPSTAALRVQTVTMSRINPLSKGRAKQRFWCPSFSQPVTCERQPTQDLGEPQWLRSTGWCWLSLGLPMSTGHHFTARFGAPAHMCGQCRGWVYTWHRQAMPDVLCSFNDSCWVLMVKVSCIFSFFSSPANKTQNMGGI